MNHQHALLREIAEFPEDDGPRLIYADWLDERDNPRGEFIRVQFQLAEGGLSSSEQAELQARESQLMAAHAADWIGPVRRYLQGWTFRRGFLERIKLSGDAFLDQAETLKREFPLQEVVLTSVGDQFEKLAKSPHLARLRGLAFEGTWLAHRAALLAHAPHLAGLESLDLRNNGVGTAALCELAHSPHLASLSRLCLARNTGLRDEGMHILLSSPLRVVLRELDLAGCGLTDKPIRLLSTSPLLKQLERLDLTGNSISLAGFEALFASPYWHQRLELRMPPGQSRRLGIARRKADGVRDAG